MTAQGVSCLKASGCEEHLLFKRDNAWAWLLRGAGSINAIFVVSESGGGGRQKQQLQQLKKVCK
jgi:hypothetical protein